MRPSEYSEKSAITAGIEGTQRLDTRGEERRQLLKSILLMAAGGLGLEAKAQSKTKPPAPEAKKQAGEKLGVEIPANPSIQIPNHEFSDTPINFAKPAGVKMEEGEFRKKAKEFAEIVKQNMAQILMPKLRAANNPQEANAAIDHFIGTMAANLASQPAFKADMEAFRQDWEKKGKKPESFIKKLNEYLNPAGQYLYYRPTQGAADMDLYPITKTSQVTVKDNKGGERVPVIHLDTGLLKRDSAPENLATVDPFFENALFFETKVQASIGSILERLSSQFKTGLFAQKIDRNEFERRVYKDFLRHEATHAFLARRFKKSGTMQSKKLAYEVPLMVPVGNGMGANIGGVLPPIMFQELCGVGVQIARTEAPIPYANIMHYYTDPEKAPTYQLVRQLLPLATLQVAPASPSKERTLRKLVEGKNAGGDSIQLTATPPFSMESARQVGELLYRVGYQLLEDSENGRLALMEKVE